MSARAARRQVYIGLMSGTSLDGISAAAVRFDEPEGGPCMRRAHQLHRHARTRRRSASGCCAAMTGGTAARVLRAARSTSADGLPMRRSRRSPRRVLPATRSRAIGSHGQTLWHDAPHSTWQFGESAVIAERSGHRRRIRLPRGATSPRAGRARRWCRSPTRSLWSDAARGARCRTSAASAT